MQGVLNFNPGVPRLKGTVSEKARCIWGEGEDAGPRFHIGIGNLSRCLLPGPRERLDMPETAAQAVGWSDWPEATCPSRRTVKQKASPVITAFAADYRVSVGVHPYDCLEELPLIKRGFRTGVGDGWEPIA